MTLDLNSTLGISARICATGILLQACELIALRKDMQPPLLLSWVGGGPSKNWMRRCLQGAFQRPYSDAILVWRGIAAASLFFIPVGSWIGAAVLASLLLSQMYFNRRFVIIFANADHMNLICLAALTLAWIPAVGVYGRIFAMGFMAFQCCLGYVSSGIDKALSSSWRNGTRVLRVFLDSSHPVPWLGAWLQRADWRPQLLSWAIILGEILFPVALFLPEWVFCSVAFIGLSFHLAIATAMGLPVFLWAFGATYPSLYFLHRLINHEAC